MNDVLDFSLSEKFIYILKYNNIIYSGGVYE